MGRWKETWNTNLVNFFPDECMVTPTSSCKESSASKSSSWSMEKSTWPRTRGMNTTTTKQSTCNIHMQFNKSRKLPPKRWQSLLEHQRKTTSIRRLSQRNMILNWRQPTFKKPYQLGRKSLEVKNAMKMILNLGTNQVHSFCSPDTSTASCFTWTRYLHCHNMTVLSLKKTKLVPA